MTIATHMTQDRIDKRIHLRASRSRVWRALTDVAEFNAWFGCRLQGRFAAGVTISGEMGCHGGGGKPVELSIERIEPEVLFSYRWHPYAVDPQRDYAAEPTTLVEFRLADQDGGTLLIVSESGFSALSPERHSESHPRHEAGWTQQLANIGRHVAS